MNDPIKYKDAGVDIDAANRATERIKRLARSTFNENVLSEIGGFGGMFNGRFADTRDPVLVARIARRVRGWCPDLAIIARARDTDHAAKLYEAGATDAVPETLEASLQLSEAVLVELGAAMGPVIASIHEKREELRNDIRAEAMMSREPRIRRIRSRAEIEAAAAD